MAITNSGFKSAHRWVRAAAAFAAMWTIDAPAQVEVNLPSLDRREAQAVILKAHWFAVSASAAVPAFVLMHGCGGAFDKRGGLSERMRTYAALLNANGIHALVLDSLSPRGEKQICTQKIGTRDITQANRRLDALAALQWLAGQPQVDPERLGLMGWSNGGSSVLAATNLRHVEVSRASVKAAFAVAFYPGCTAELQRGYQTTTRLLMLVGEADDWTPAAACKELANKTSGTAPEIEIYPGAYHGFDSTAPLRLRKEVPNGANPGQGVTVGGDPEGLKRSRERLKRFLMDVVLAR